MGESSGIEFGQKKKSNAEMFLQMFIIKISDKITKVLQNILAALPKILVRRFSKVVALFNLNFTTISTLGVLLDSLHLARDKNFSKFEV